MKKLKFNEVVNPDAWEVVSNVVDEASRQEKTTSRIAVDGGWLYKYEVTYNPSPDIINVVASTAFVPAKATKKAAE